MYVKYLALWPVYFEDKWAVAAYSPHKRKIDPLTIGFTILVVFVYLLMKPTWGYNTREKTRKITLGTISTRVRLKIPRIERHKDSMIIPDNFRLRRTCCGLVSRDYRGLITANNARLISGFAVVHRVLSALRKHANNIGMWKTHTWGDVFFSFVHGLIGYQTLHHSIIK